MQAPPTTAAVCPAADLATAASACQFGANTAGCQGFFQFEQQQRPQCASCLAPFDFDFSAEVGIVNCTLPFLSPGCNHSVACLENCVTTTCSQCPNQGAISQCQDTGPTVQCSSFGGGVMCVQAAIGGMASFCAEPPTANFGTWLQTVGTHYCLQ
jgi:hypothetical protein